MITAGSVRGNWRRRSRCTRSTWPACRDSSGEPHRGQCRVAQCHSARPTAWKSQGAAAGRPPAPAASPRSGTQSSRSPGASPGSASTAKRVTPSLSPRSTRVPSGASAGEAQATSPVDRAQPVAGDDEHQRVRVGPPLVQPAVVVAALAHPVVGVADRAGAGAAGALTCSRRSRYWPPAASLGSRHEHPHRRRSRARSRPSSCLPGRPLRAKWIAETFLDDANCYTEVRGCTATPAPGAASGSRSRARAWASRLWLSMRTSSSASTTCSRSSASGRAAR